MSSGFKHLAPRLAGLAGNPNISDSRPRVMGFEGGMLLKLKEAAAAIGFWSFEGSLGAVETADGVVEGLDISSGAAIGDIAGGRGGADVAVARDVIEEIRVMVIEEGSANLIRTTAHHRWAAVAGTLSMIRNLWLFLLLAAPSMAGEWFLFASFRSNGEGLLLVEPGWAQVGASQRR